MPRELDGVIVSIGMNVRLISSPSWHTSLSLISETSGLSIGYYSEVISKTGGASEKQGEATLLLLPQSHAIGTISILLAANVISRPRWLPIIKSLPHPVPRHNIAPAE